MRKSQIDDADPYIDKYKATNIIEKNSNPLIIVSPVDKK